MSYILSVLVYAMRDNETLLMHRNKEPNLGLWTAPGGKIEKDEAPYETARREMLEETGLTIQTMQLRGLCTEVSPLDSWHWMLFIFTTSHFTGEVHADLREGELAWIPLDDYLTTLPIPQADAIFAPPILRDGEAFFQAKFTYDDALKLIKWERH